MDKKEFAKGVFFTAVAKYSNIIISLIITAILARLLTPTDFGVITIATVILSFFAIISDLGIAPAIVQNKDLTESDLGHIYSFTCFLGVAVSVVFYLCSPIITNFYDVDSLLNICKLLSINLFFSSLNIVPNSLLLKDKRFKFIAVRTITVQAILGVIAVIAAFTGLGMYSLLINPIGSSIFLFVINYAQHPLKFSAKISKQSIDKIASYSAYQFLFSTVSYFSRNLDNLLIGRYIGVADLGYYDKSYRSMLLPLSAITHVFTPVLHPIFSEHQNDKDYIFNVYLKLLTVLAYIGFPLSVFLYFEAAHLITFIYGDQWEQSIPIFEILAISVAPQMLCSTLGSIFLSTNDTKKLFKLGNVNTFINVAAIVVSIAIFGELKMVSIFICVAFYVNFAISFSYLFRSVFSKSIFILCKRLSNPLLLSIGLIPLSYYIVYLDLQSLVSIVVSVLVIVAVSLVYIQLSGDYDIVTLIKKRSFKVW